LGSKKVQQQPGAQYPFAAIAGVAIGRHRAGIDSAISLWRTPQVNQRSIDRPSQPSLKGLVPVSETVKMATSSAAVPAGHNRRRADRQPFNGKVVIGFGGESGIGRIRNISPFGCNVVADVDWMRVGRIVSLKVGGRRVIQAIVRWTHDGTTGLEFLRPIDLAEAEWLEGDGA
jgi:hypothetical protein